MWFPKAASVTFTVGTLMAFDGSGNVTPATSSSTKVLGLTNKAAASTDADYASNTLIPIRVPLERYNIVTAAYTGTTPVVGVAYPLSDGNTINGSSSAHSILTVISVNTAASTVDGFLNAGYDSFNSA